jgi:hypothetical protein
LENLTLCPHCNSPLMPFNLLEDDRRFGVLYSKAKIEDGLAPHGLRCSGKNRHEFGYIGERRVEIDCDFAKRCIPAQDITWTERWNDKLAAFALRWLPLPAFARAFCRDQIIVPWQVAESWYLFYDPHAGELSPEEETRIRADSEADRFGEDLEPPAEDFPWAGDDGDREDDPDAWDEEPADQEDRDHDTYFPDDDDSEDAWLWDDDDSDEWDDDLYADEEPEPSEDEDTNQ